MKNLLTILAALALAASAQAGCGKTSTAEGTLKSFDEKTKELTCLLYTSDAADE